ncbi:hypothetical protein QFC19_002491 [Naganishia cerealis]|uniref:Uncharacterized protein n=1 Tax=Naganishia cerealis TaxID=610337 RepID=A0ACC2W9Y8_9TREE|nr:hypothetical protein QFC19_002491 [Naganishia cerealis]
MVRRSSLRFPSSSNAYQRVFSFGNVGRKSSRGWIRISCSLPCPPPPDKPREQIAHLKDLLSALGMKGRPTKAKAKAIKEKREMAAELGTLGRVLDVGSPLARGLMKRDVLEFEAKRGLGITSRRTGIASRTTLDEGGTSKKRRATVTRKIDDSPSEGSSSDSDRPSRLDQTMHLAVLDTDDEIDESEDAGKGRNTKGSKARTNMQVAKGGKQRLKVRAFSIS